MFYQDFDSKIKDATKRKNLFKKTAKALDIVATVVGIACISAVMPFSFGLIATELPTILVATAGIIACAGVWGLSYMSSAYANAVTYEIKYFNEKKMLQEMFKESENTPEKRGQKRNHIAFLRNELKKQKLYGNEGLEETLQKSKKATEIAIAISNNSEILRTSCISRHERAKNLLKFRQNSRQKS